jgi:hypothetical protein
MSFYIKNCYSYGTVFQEKTSKRQEKPLSLLREHHTLQNTKILIIFRVICALLDDLGPDSLTQENPELKNQQIRYLSGERGSRSQDGSSPQLPSKW